jgi:hypothetical protein
LGRAWGKEVSAVNYCRACREDFASLSAFDGHRTGRHTYTFREGLERGTEDGRRCLDPDELEAMGWHQDGQGRWKLPLSEAQRQRLAGMRAERHARCPGRTRDVRRDETGPGDQAAIPAVLSL